MNNLPKTKNFTRYIDGLNFRFLDAMEDLVRIRDTNGEILFENRPMRSILESLITRKEEDNQAKKIFFELYKEIKDQDDLFNREVLLDGKLYAVNVSPVYDNLNNLDGYIEVFRDITLERNTTKQLYQTNQKINEDILLARTIQKSILPTKTKYRNIYFQFGHIASDNLSGDVFDVIEINSNKIGFYMADVVGHGISASIMTMFIRQSMRSIVEENPFLSASDTILELKRMFTSLKLDISQYFTIIYFIVDFKEKSIRYVNAGHNCYPILFNQSKVGVLHNTGKFISNLFPETNYEEKQLDLIEGNKILLYTDGLIEASNAEGEFYGEDRLLEWIKTNCSQKDLVKELLNDIEDFRWKEQRDDVAILYLEVRRDENEA